MISDDVLVQHIYRVTVDRGRPPRARDVAEVFGIETAEAFAGLSRIASRRLLALAPESGEIVMAPPFSAIPTAFAVSVGDRSYFANCVWDAFGVAAALHRDAVVDAGCACCGDPISLAIRDGAPSPERAIAHFAVPAALWWDHITYT